MTQPNANNTEPKLSGDMASHMPDNSAMGAPFSGVAAKMPMSGMGEMNTIKPVATPSDGGGKNM